ncbi:BglG family transcription antiterminator [Clostridium nigeriense]|uniref:BglG family transcription antiterminator n=1 Tax=Clostridium nigeriense TaxID=1805470 RepID=UPI003D34EBC1
MDKELVVIIKLLLEKTLVTIKDLEDDTGLTTRQVTYRLNKVNNLLKSNGSEIIALKHKKDIILKSEIRDSLLEILNEYSKENIYYLSKDERLTFIYLTLFINLEYLSLNHFINSMKVSRSSVLCNIKELEDILKESNIYIKNNRTLGYYLVGPEVEIRRFMISFASKSLSGNRDCKILDLLIDEYDLDSFKDSRDIISKLANDHNITFVEDRLQDFIYIYIFLKSRMLSNEKKEYPISKLSNISVMESMKEYDFVKDLLKNHGNIDNIKPFDLNYISAWIIGISVGNIKDKTADMAIISRMVIKIMKRFENISGFHYIDQEKIFEQLYSHFRSAYYRLLFKLPIDNPLCERVKEEYKELYKIVKETMKPFNDLFEQEIPEDEIGYLTIHFGAILFNEREHTISTKKIALITCSGGVGSSALLYAELNNLFPELNFLLPVEISKLKEFEESVDIVFTSNYYDEVIKLKKPIIKVNPVMTLKEKNNIKRDVSILLGNGLLKQPKVEEVISIIKKYVQVSSESMLYNELAAYFYNMENLNHTKNTGITLSNMINENLICFNVKANNWEDAIRNSAAALVDNKVVTSEYVDSMVNIAKDSGPYIVVTKHVALPHAKPEDGAKETAMGIGILENPIHFGNKANDPVKYVFSLSSLDNEKHLQAMSELIGLLEDEEFYSVLDNAQNAKEVMDYIKSCEL